MNTLFWMNKNLFYSRSRDHPVKNHLYRRFFILMGSYGNKINVKQQRVIYLYINTWKEIFLPLVYHIAGTEERETYIIPEWLRHRCVQKKNRACVLPLSGDTGPQRGDFSHRLNIGLNIVCFPYKYFNDWVSHVQDL